MPKGSKKFKQNITEVWPEIFKDIDINVVPLNYLHSIHIHFKNEKTWVIDVQKSMLKHPHTGEKEIEGHLQSLFTEYEDEIDNVDFRLDTARVKEDIEKRTKYFMKKRK